MATQLGALRGSLRKLLCLLTIPLPCHSQCHNRHIGSMWGFGMHMMICRLTEQYSGSWAPTPGVGGFERSQDNFLEHAPGLCYHLQLYLATWPAYDIDCGGIYTAFLFPP